MALFCFGVYRGNESIVVFVAALRATATMPLELVRV